MMEFDGVEIFRSTKKNSGYGNKPFYATKESKSKGYYINTKDVKVGTTYYYKLRGYVVIDGQKYYLTCLLRNSGVNAVTKLNKNYLRICLVITLLIVIASICARANTDSILRTANGLIINDK